MLKSDYFRIEITENIVLIGFVTLLKSDYFRIEIEHIVNGYSAF
ncbi:hypothetical protein DSM1535_0087 [Methanobacterium formicicum]|uniref:Uncharacterized protein n=1 Tax=Methanobacterium formicicum TaxID=2162 RepID=A0A090I0N4_METFO|nr:hypothetical protein DSM1535_0087 [Methanobacterium formicicum]